MSSPNPSTPAASYEDENKSALQAFLDVAHEVFGLKTFPGRGINNPYYMYLPVRVTDNRLATDRTAPEEMITLDSPFRFLSGVPEKGRPECLGEPSASLPSVCVLVGEYGLGKTEFVFQFCEHLCEQRQAGAPAPLPINLAMCRWSETVTESVLNAPSSDCALFRHFLFRPILERHPGVDERFIDEVLLPAIHAGDVILILDGLDELVATVAQHRAFFDGLRSLLDPARLNLRRTKFQCLISMRLEYVMSVDTPTASELVHRLGATKVERHRPTVHFLHVDFLNESWIQSYLSETTQIGADLERLRAYPGFFELLHRPIFLQMLAVLDRSPFDFPISSLTHPAELVRAFVTLAGAVETQATTSPFHIERDRLAEHSGYIWDTDLLARAALANFEDEGPQFSFSPDDLSLFLLPAAENDGNKPAEGEDAMRAVHKCPFLHKVSCEEVVFAHKVFLEYFISRGIVLDLEQKGKAFHRLVLNADMRKFLRFLIEQKFGNVADAWYQQTFESYGLDKQREWGMEKAKFLELLPELEQVRRSLLDSMTEPRAIHVEATRQLIRRFLRLDAEHCLHPLYLMYNYEAVAVYLWRHRWHEEDIWLLDSFENRLLERARDLTHSLLEPDAYWLRDRFPEHLGAEPKELLAERIADIGRRLRMRSIADLRLHEFVKTADIKKRMDMAADLPVRGTSTDASVSTVVI